MKHLITLLSIIREQVCPGLETIYELGKSLTSEVDPFPDCTHRHTVRSQFSEISTSKKSEHDQGVVENTYPQIHC